VKYRLENYKNCERFNEQYQEIYRFLLAAETMEFNEHFQKVSIESLLNVNHKIKVHGNYLKN